MTAHRPIQYATRAPYLLISRIGPASLHRQWLPASGKPAFDVLLSGYDPQTAPITGDGIMFEYRPGTKVAGYGEIIRAHAALIRQYRYVALFDDDLEIDADGIARMFRIADEYAVKIAQPALEHDSYFTYACLLQHKGFILRHVNYIEMMCPVFRTDVLLSVAPLFELGFESGIDLVWSAMTHEAPTDFAVIDCVPVRHARPVGAIKAVNGFVDGRTYGTDIRAILRRFDLPWLPCLPYGGVRRGGKYTRSRLALTVGSARLASAIPIRSIRFRIRAVGTYWRQLIRDRARNIGVKPLYSAETGQRDTYSSSFLTSGSLINNRKFAVKSNCYSDVSEVLPVCDKKLPYKTPRLTRAGSFEELTQSSRKWDNLAIFGMTGGAANLDAVS